MEISRVRVPEASRARGIVMVIDVIRAFTVAAYALEGGARRLWLVRTVEEALSLHAAEPDTLLAGEIAGRLIDGFHHNNSPAAMMSAKVRDRTIIQRTGAGTQGAVGAENASHLVVCSLVNARATAEYVRSLAAATGEPITLLPTASPEEPDCIEDDLCADYVEAVLRHRADAGVALQQGVERLRSSGRLDVFAAAESDFPADDIATFLAVDRFSFVMPGTREKRAGVRYVEVVRQDTDRR